jgi:hypothetical protein
MKVSSAFSGFVSGSFKTHRRGNYDRGQVYHVEVVENDEIEVYHMDKTKHYGRFVFDCSKDCYINEFRIGIPYFCVNSLV